MDSPTDSVASRAIFIFNGDADGIIAQHLLLLGGTAPELRLTGLKRDLRLLRHLRAEAPHANDARPLDLYVCDINLKDNRDDLDGLLQNPTNHVTWYDHHEPGEIPVSPRLRTRIATGRGACTGLLVHADLLAQGRGQDPRWAAIAAYGDNLPEAVDALLAPLGVDAATRATLREAGELINYNAHGETPDDVLFQPLHVAELMGAYRDPLAFCRESGLIEPLRAQKAQDEESMGAMVPTLGGEGAALYMLPAEGWARRLGSTWVSRAALEHPGRAFAVLHPLGDGSYQVSIRAPRGREGAATAASLASEFPSGGGRALAAGINRLPADQIDTFARRFMDTYRTM